MLPLSTFLQISDTIKLDSGLMVEVKKLVDHATEKSSPSNLVWIPLISAIVGGMIAIGGQWVIKSYESLQKRKDEINAILSLCSELRLQLHFYFENYAYFEQNTEYQFHQYRLCTDTSEKQKYLEEHYKSNIELMSLHKQIIDLISKFVGNANKFERVVSHKISFEESLKSIEEIQFGYAKDYSKLKELVQDNQVSDDIAELTTTYREQLDPFADIINEMATYNLKR